MGDILKTIYKVITKFINKDLIIKFRNLSLLRKLLILLILVVLGVVILSMYTASVVRFLDTINKNEIIDIALIFLLILLFWVVLNYKNKNYAINLVSIELDDLDLSSKTYKIIIENTSIRDITLKGFQVNYRYYKGMLSSLGEYREIKFDHEYLINLPIDFKYSDKQQLVKNLDNPIKIFGTRNHNKNEFDFRLTVNYSLPQNRNWHPCGDWDIYFEVFIFDTNGNKYLLLENQTWNSIFSKKINRKEKTLRKCYLHYDYSVMDCYYLSMWLYNFKSKLFNSLKWRWKYKNSEDGFVVILKKYLNKKLTSPNT